MDSSTSSNGLNSSEQHDTPSKKRKVFNVEEKSFEDGCNDRLLLSSSINQSLNDEKSEHKLNDDVEADIQFSSSPDNKEISSTPENLSSTSSPRSEASESDWQPPTHGAIDWIYSQILNDRNPREIISHLMPNLSSIPSHLSDWDVWRVQDFFQLIRMLSEPPRRTKLTHINTLADVVRLINTSKKIIVLTGAGVSVSCGIPDFRSRNGVYARLAVDFPDLPNPEAMFSINYFQHDPRPFFKFAKEIYPGQFKPSLVHRFISLLEKRGKLLRNYTQNIDTLEQVAGITRVVQCHGSFSHATCQVCKHRVTGEEIKKDVFNQVVPICSRCPPGEGAGILKPDIVFFGENLPEHFHRQMTADKEEADLLIVIGSALKVRPVALIPNSLAEEVPQILVNREPLPHMDFDVELLGDADGVVAHLCSQLGEDYSEIYEGKERLTEITSLPEDMSLVDDLTNGTNGDVNENPHENPQTSSSTNTDAPVTSASVEVTSNGSCDEVSDQSAAPTQEDLKGMWRSRWKQSISRKIPAGSFYYDDGHRYIFPGAEIPPEEDSDSSDESSSDDPDAGEDSPMTRILPHMQPISNQEAGSSLQERPTDDGSSLGS